MMSLRSLSASSSSSSLFYVVMGFSLVLAVIAQPSFDCGSRDAFNSLRPKFTSLSVFPNPVQVGQQAHIRTIVQLPENNGLVKGAIKEGTIWMELKHENEVFASMQGIPLCNASSSIVCTTLGPGDNAISFDYLVPKIPTGKYTITLRIAPDKNATSLNEGCLMIELEVADAYAKKDKYHSWIAAALAGEAQFEHEDYLKRNLQEFTQVGPVGNIDPIVAYSFPWGTFIDVQGSEDLIQPYFLPGGYVWGLHGEMVEITYQGTTRTHVYKGDYYVGYVTSLAKRALDVEILTGAFTLTWQISQNSDGVVNSILFGTIVFDSAAVLPLGFSNPITVGRLVTADITTDDEGILRMKGQRNECLDDPDCNAVIDASDKDDHLSGWQIGLITAVIVGVALIFVVVISLFKWHRRSKRHEEEDGIFSATRKPEYGNALVVDDIIQETREHSPNIMPPLARRGIDAYSDSDTDTDTDDFSRSRSRSRTPSRSRSPPPYADRAKSPSRSRSRSLSRSASGSYSDSEDYTDAGSSASRA